MAHINIINGLVEGIDMTARVNTLKQMFFKKRIKSSKIKILSNINFQAKSGDVIGIVGRNGSGKSSILKIISGNYPMSSGTLEVKGKVTPMIEMGIGLDPELTGRQNIILGLIYSGRIEQYNKELEEEIIEFSGIADKMDVPFKLLSSGMQTRLAFSISIHQNPEILLLDEVFAAGDAQFVKKSKEKLLKKIQEVSITIIVSHADANILNLCNLVYIVDGGQIYDYGDPQKMIDKYRKEILEI